MVRIRVSVSVRVEVRMLTTYGRLALLKQEWTFQKTNQRPLRKPERCVCVVPA